MGRPIQIATCPICGMIPAACVVEFLDADIEREHADYARQGYVISVTDETVQVDGCKCKAELTARRIAAREALPPTLFDEETAAFDEWASRVSAQPPGGCQ